MKKNIKLILFLLLLLPLIVNATSTFEDGKAIANKYMKENFDDDYTKYIVSENTKYGFSKEKGIFNVSGFNKGGFINKYEYDLSSNSGSESSSWLYDANGYWSLTENDGNIYVIGKGNSDKGKEFNNRVVEYVRNTTKVSGKGTYSNPWVIEKTYSVTIKANRNDLLDSIYYKSKECGKDSCKADVFINKNAEFYLNFKDGYEYDLSGSGTNLCNSSGYSASSGKLVISNVVDDVECYFNIKESEYKITFDANGGTLSGDNSKNVTYTKSYGTLPEPIREGYIFSGWYTEKVNGNKIDSSSILDTAGDKTLYAHWKSSQVAVTINGAVSEKIAISSGSTVVATVTTDSNAQASLNIEPGTYTFTSNVAKSITNVSSSYSKSVTITESTKTINFYPDGAVYWFGNGTNSGQSLYEKFGGIGGANENMVDTNPYWGYSTNSFYAISESQASTIYFAHANSKKAFSTLKSDGTRYTLLKSLSVAKNDYSVGGCNGDGSCKKENGSKWCYYYAKGLVSYYDSNSSPDKPIDEVLVSTSLSVHSINISSSYNSIYFSIRAGAGACHRRWSEEEVTTYAVWME